MVFGGHLLVLQLKSFEQFIQPFIFVLILLKNLKLPFLHLFNLRNLFSFDFFCLLFCLWLFDFFSFQNLVKYSLSFLQLLQPDFNLVFLFLLLKQSQIQFLLPLWVLVKYDRQLLVFFVKFRKLFIILSLYFLLNFSVTLLLHGLKNLLLPRYILLNYFSSLSYFLFPPLQLNRHLLIPRLLFFGLI